MLITSKHNCRVVLFVMEVQEQALTASSLLENLTHACVPHVPQCDYSITSPVLSYLHQWPIIHLFSHQWLTPGMDFIVSCLRAWPIKTTYYHVNCFLLHIQSHFFYMERWGIYYWCNYQWCISGILLPLESIMSLIFTGCVFLCLDRYTPGRALFILYH